MMQRESPVSFYQRQCEAADRKARRGLVWFVLVWAAGILMAILVCLTLAGCAGGPSQQDAADLIRVGAVVDKACETLSPEDCTAGREALGRLGVSLQDVQKTRLLASAWDTLQPVITAGIGWLLAGGGG